MNRICLRIHYNSTRSIVVWIEKADVPVVEEWFISTIDGVLKMAIPDTTRYIRRTDVTDIQLYTNTIEYGQPFQNDTWSIELV